MNENEGFKPIRESVREKLKHFRGILEEQGTACHEQDSIIPKLLSPMEKWEQEVLTGERDSFLIYQLKDNEANRDISFERQDYQ